MHKFFVSKDKINGDLIVIDGPDKKHISNVLRLGIGDNVIASQGRKNFLSRIKSLEKNRVILEIISEEDGKNEAEINIRLYQGLAKGNKLDYIIQKGTEIGIKEFVIVEMERSVSRIKNKKWIKNRLERYNKIAEEAAKQSKRDYVPKVSKIISTDKMIEELKEKSHILIPYEDEKSNSIKKVLQKMDPDELEDINIIIGPEGGISEEEINRLKNLKGETLSLGPRILRTETAGLVASTIVLYELGDLGSD